MVVFWLGFSRVQKKKRVASRRELGSGSGLCVSRGRIASARVLWLSVGLSLSSFQTPTSGLRGIVVGGPVAGLAGGVAAAARGASRRAGRSGRVVGAASEASDRARAVPPRRACHRTQQWGFVARERERERERDSRECFLKAQKLGVEWCFFFFRELEERTWLRRRCRRGEGSNRRAACLSRASPTWTRRGPRWPGAGRRRATRSRRRATARTLDLNGAETSRSSLVCLCRARGALVRRRALRRGRGRRSRPSPLCLRALCDSETL